jgi:hypothetical protein
MPVIARDAFAAGHLVYAWPFPVGPECEVSCRDDEQVVMCPAWTIGDRLGPGRHLWRTPDPTRPVSVYFVSHGSVDVEFELITRFQLPATNQPIQIRAAGSVLVRCGDPGVLIAQFIGLPFDSIDDGIKRSVARSVERMVARLLTRRVVMGGTIEAITDPSMLQPIIEEIVSYNPTAGAVFGIELSQLARLQIEASDGRITQVSPPLSPPISQVHVAPTGRYEGSSGSIGLGEAGDHGRDHGIDHRLDHTNGWAPPTPVPEAVAHHDTQRGVGQAAVRASTSGVHAAVTPDSPGGSGVVSGMTGGTPEDGRGSGMHQNLASLAAQAASIAGASSSLHQNLAANLARGAGQGGAGPGLQGSPELSLGHGGLSSVAMGTGTGAPASAGGAAGAPGVITSELSGSASGGTPGVVSGSIAPRAPMLGAAPPPAPAPRRNALSATLPPPLPSIPPRPATSPGIGGAAQTPDVSAEGSAPRAARLASEPDARSSIMAIGARIGDSQVTSGEILSKVEPGKRVLVPGPHGLMQSATVRQLLSGYYELEVGSSGETIWVPMAHVVPE